MSCNVKIGNYYDISWTLSHNATSESSDFYGITTYTYSDDDLTEMSNALTIIFGDTKDPTKMLFSFEITMTFKSTYSDKYEFISFPSKNTVKISHLDALSSISINSVIYNIKPLIKSEGCIKVVSKNSPSPSLYIGSVEETISGMGSISVGIGGIMASGNGALAVGQTSKAIGDYSQATGNGVLAQALSSHAEGTSTRAYGTCSHAEGNGSKAHGYGSHAEGYYCSSLGNYSHAGGSKTHAENNASTAIGKYNKAMTAGGSDKTTVGDAFVIGNGKAESATQIGTESNAFRVTFGGGVYGLSAFNSSGADYAEFFEWHDGNPDAEDRIGLFVTLKGRKIVLANPGDYILGVTSGNPAMVGNSDEDWLGRWQKDAYDRFLKEYLEYDETLIDTTDLDEEAISELLSDPNVEMRDDQYYRRSERIVDHETPSWRYKANPNYDSSKPYVERKNRPEWSYVGMMGVLSVRDDNTCEVDGYARVSSDGCATKSDIHIPGETYRVVERVEDGVVRVIVK